MSARKADIRVPRTKRMWGIFHTILEKSELLTPRKTEKLIYDISELLECCESFPREINRLAIAVKSAHKDSTALWKTTCELLGEFEHIRYHIRQAVPTLRTMQHLARNMPPVSRKTDDDINDEMLAEAWAMFNEVRESWASAARNSSGQTGVARSKRKTQPIKKRKRKASPKR